MKNETAASLIQEIKELYPRIISFFESSDEYCLSKDTTDFDYWSERSLDYFWNLLPEHLQTEGLGLIDGLLATCAMVASTAKTCVLTGPEDVAGAKEAAKAMRAAIRLRSYWHSGPEVIHDEGTVLGFKPATEGEDSGIPPKRARKDFGENFNKLWAIVKLIEASPCGEGGEGFKDNNGNRVEKYRPGTAFIMMWMDPSQPELEDRLDTIKAIFLSFGIKALRADDIEHDGKITDRILNEIKTSEFLIADLSGARPNVYYEIGFAHAMGKRVILFRKEGTSLHFDLSGYNCREFENLRDLKAKLIRRLIALTGKTPNEQMPL